MWSGEGEVPPSGGSPVDESPAGAATHDRPIAQLLTAVRAFCERPERHLTPEQLAQQLIQLRRVCDLLELEFSLSAARFAATDEYDLQGSVSPISWIRHQCRMSGHAAAERVSVGEEAERLPLSVKAMEEGRIGFAHLALLARTSSALHESSTSDSLDETALLASAAELSVGRFRHACHDARHAGDPDAYAADEARSVEDRSLELNTAEDGFVFIRGLLDSAGGAVLRTALEPLAQKSGADDDRHRDRRLADALVELAGHGLDSGAVPQRASQRAHLQVTAALETLLWSSGAPAGEMQFSLPISSRMVQRIACDAAVTRVLLGPDSAIVDVGRAYRVVPGSTRRALNVRDKCCQWPGCDRPSAWTAAHHLTHWSRGGKTNLANLILLCHRHHWMVHEGGWQIARDDSGRILTIPPISYLSRHYFARGPDHGVAA